MERRLTALKERPPPQPHLNTRLRIVCHHGRRILRSFWCTAWKVGKVRLISEPRRVCLFHLLNNVETDTIGICLWSHITVSIYYFYLASRVYFISLRKFSLGDIKSLSQLALWISETDQFTNGTLASWSVVYAPLRFVLLVNMPWSQPNFLILCCHKYFCLHDLFFGTIGM